MIVVVIIGLLAALGLPAFQRAKVNSYASRIANDIRVFSGAFETHALETGTWAPDGAGNNLPATVRPYFEGSRWYEEPIAGGSWDWEYDRLGYTAAIALVIGDDQPEVFQRVDEMLDNGDLASGIFVKSGDRYLYVLAP